MQSKTRNAFARYLRQQGFTVQTNTGFLSFNNYSILFKDELDYAFIYNPYAPAIHLQIPYAEPEAMLNKIRYYFSQAAQPKQPQIIYRKATKARPQHLARAPTQP